MALYRGDTDPQKLLVKELSKRRNVPELEIKAKLHTMYLFEYLLEYRRNAVGLEKLLEFYEREEKEGFRGFVLNIVDFYKGSFVDWANKYIVENKVTEMSAKLKANYTDAKDVEKAFLKEIVARENDKYAEELYKKYKSKRCYTKGLIDSLGKFSPEADSLVRMFYAEQKSLGKFLLQLCSECPEYLLPHIVKVNNLKWYKEKK